MSHVQERYTPRPVATNETLRLNGSAVGGFLCTADGVVSLTREDGGGVTTTLFMLTVSSGIYYPMPFYIGVNGGTFAASGGAAGCLGVV